MVFTCPHCAAAVSRWETFRFMRLASVPCPGCGRLVSLDKHGRMALWVGVLLGMIASLAAAALQMEPAAGIGLLLAGVLADAWIVPRAGTLVPSREG